MTARCPTPAALDSWLTGRAAGAPEVGEVRAHVNACPACQCTLDRLSDDAELRQWAAADAPDPSLTPALARLLDGPPAGRLPARPLPERVGPYRIEAELGRGGMGVVYRAADEALQRTVALKVVLPDLLDGPARERFVREARAAARVRHDHVVSVYAVGETPDGTPYLAMEYLAGPTLAAVLRERPRLDPREAAELTAQVADGLAAAHAAGLVHRDVKPANVLLDPATGRAKLADFGLARAEVGPTALTGDGHLAGTPAYMSPEQARGDHDVGPAADVYGLGAALYEMLTGAVPFRAAPHLVLRQIVQDEPRPPRQLHDAVPRDLETVCLKALAKEPDRRYASARAFADDLRRFIRGEPVLARPAGSVERTWRWCRRNPREAMMGAAMVVAVLAGFGAVAAERYRDGQNFLRVCAALRAGVELGEFTLRTSAGLAADHCDRLLRNLDDCENELRRRGPEPTWEFTAATWQYQLGIHLSETTAAAEARAMLRRAADRFAVVNRAGYDDSTATIYLGATHIYLAHLEIESGRWDAAGASLDQAEAIFRNLARQQADNLTWMRNLALCADLRGDVELGRGRPDDARRWYDEARPLTEQISRLTLPESQLGRYRVLRRGSNAHHRGWLALRSGDPAGALDLLQAARVDRATLVSELPEDVLCRRDLARTDLLLAETLRTLHHSDEAAEACQRARTTLDALLAEAPAFLDGRTASAEAWRLQAALDHAAGRTSAALDRARQEFARVLRTNPESRSARDGLNRCEREAIAVGNKSDRE